MTASINPDENSPTPREANPHEPPAFVYDDPDAPATHTESTATESYVPEREFVLLPLFRRIGELLGIRKREEPEYVYQANADAQATEVRESVSLGHEEPQSSIAEPNQAGERRELWAQSSAVEPLTNELSESVEQAASARVDEPETRIQSSEPLQKIEAPAAEMPAREPVAFHAVEAHTELQKPFGQPEEAEAEAPLLASFDSSPEASPQPEPITEAHHQEAASEVSEVAAQRSAQPSQPERKRVAPRRRQPDEIDEAIAAMREAASKFSAAISEAAEWLSAKEAEFMRKAERSFAPAPKTRRVQSSSARRATPIQPLPNSAASPTSEPTPASQTSTESESAPKWEPLQFPGLQREAAWEEPSEDAAAEQPLRNHEPEAPPAYAIKRRPALVRRRPRVPFWKRVDWAAQFTSTRIAVLGGVIMAMLIVAGITFARRPASEVLPPQTRPVQPGGVTVTTHPVHSPANAATQQRRTAPPEQRVVTPAPHHSQRAVAYEEPDVVTHYYKQKPSPSKQSTVAGVKHYSDMN